MTLHRTPPPYASPFEALGGSIINGLRIARILPRIDPALIPTNVPATPPQLPPPEMIAGAIQGVAEARQDKTEEGKEKEGGNESSDLPEASHLEEKELDSIPPLEEQTEEPEVAILRPLPRQPHATPFDAVGTSLVRGAAELADTLAFVAGVGKYAPPCPPPDEPVVELIPYQAIGTAAMGTLSNVKNKASTVAAAVSTAVALPGQAKEAIDNAQATITKAKEIITDPSKAKEMTAAVVSGAVGGAVDGAKKSLGFAPNAPVEDPLPEEKGIPIAVEVSSSTPSPSLLIDSLTETKDRIDAPEKEKERDEDPVAKAKRREEKGKDKEKANGELGPSNSAPPQSSWLAPVWGMLSATIAAQGIRAGLVVLDRFLSSQFLPSDKFPQGARVLEELKIILQKALDQGEAPHEALQMAWEKIRELGNYHVDLGFGMSNPSPITEEGDSSVNHGNSPPTTLLVSCQDAYEAVRKDFRLVSDMEHASSDPEISDHILTIEEEEALQELEEKTDQLVESFCHRTLHFSVMRAIDAIFGDEANPVEYNKIIQNGTLEGASIKEEFLSQYGSIRGFFYRILYNIILWFVRPLIEETTRKAIEDLRGFLKTEHRLIENKLEALNAYLSNISVHNAVTDFFTHTPKMAGNLDEFLKKRLKTFGTEEYSKQDLIQLFQDYLVENYVPRPQVKIYRWRVPLVSTFTEWIIQVIRKQAVRHFLKKSQLIDGMLREGGDAVFNAQLNLRHLLLEKLTQIEARIKQSSQESDEGENRTDLEAKKAQLINDDLRILIRALSENLLAFINVEACGNRNDELWKLYQDHQNPSLVQTTIQQVAQAFQQPESVDKILEAALTHMIETAFVTLLEDTDTRAESQLQNLFQMLNKAFDYNDPAEKRANEAKFRREIAQADRRIDKLLEGLTNSALQATLEDKLKKSAPERHRQVVSSVSKEAESMHAFSASLSKVTTYLMDLLNGEADSSMDVSDSEEDSVVEDGSLSDNIHGELAATIALIEKQLNHFSSFLDQNQLYTKYYRDTRVNIYNAHAKIIAHLNQLSKMVRQIAEANEKISECEHIIDELQPQLLKNPFHKRINNKIKALAKQIHELIKDTDAKKLFEKKLSEIKKLHRKLSIIQEKKAKIEQIERLKAQKDQTEQRIKEAKEIASLLKSFKELSDQYHRTPSEDISKRMEAMCLELKDHPNLELRDIISKHLLSKRQHLQELHYEFHQLFGFFNKDVFTYVEKYRIQQTKIFNNLEKEIHTLKQELNRNYEEQLRKIDDKQEDVKETVDVFGAVKADLDKLKLLTTKDRRLSGRRSGIAKKQSQYKQEVNEIVRRLRRIQNPTVKKFIREAGITSDMNRLYALFHAHEDSPFNQLTKYREEQEELLGSLKKRYLKVQDKLHNDSSESLNEAEKGCRREIESRSEILCRELEEFIETAKKKKEALKEDIRQQAPCFKETAEQVDEIVEKYFCVQELVSIGADALHNEAVPLVKETVAPSIKQKIKTMISSLAKPFHYEQIGLNLIMVDIADRQRLKTSNR